MAPGIWETEDFDDEAEAEEGVDSPAPEDPLAPPTGGVPVA